jgi:hypothetical protein
VQIDFDFRTWPLSSFFLLPSPSPQTDLKKTLFGSSPFPSFHFDLNCLEAAARVAASSQQAAALPQQMPLLFSFRDQKFQNKNNIAKKKTGTIKKKNIKTLFFSLSRLSSLFSLSLLRRSKDASKLHAAALPTSASLRERMCAFISWKRGTERSSTLSPLLSVTTMSPQRPILFRLVF